MKGHIKAFAGFGVITKVLASGSPPAPSVTVIHKVDLSVRADVPDVHIAAIVPTESGQIGINPPPSDAVKGTIGKNTQYLTDLGTTTNWIGPNPSYITVATTTSTKSGGQTAVATITKGVSAAKGADGGLDILISPAVKAKLEAIAKEVTPCAAKRSTNGRFFRRQGGPSCGLADFVERVAADPELDETFSRQLTDQAWRELDEGYVSGDEGQPGWEGDGGVQAEGDEGYFSDDGEGWYEGSVEGEGESTVETFVFASEEEAAAIAAGAGTAGGEAAFGGSTLTSGSFLAMVWSGLIGAGSLQPVYHIPKESIQKISKTKTTTGTKTQSTTSTQSSSACTSTTPFPACGSDCVPTKVKNTDAKATDTVDWACSEGKTKDCACYPGGQFITHDYDQAGQQGIWAALDEIEKTPETPDIECPGLASNAPSQFFGDITKNFCPLAMSLKEGGTGSVAYDIYGNKIPILARSAGHLLPRSPPESQDSYKDYKFFLHWTPKAGSCLIDQANLCTDAFDQLIKSPCGQNHGSAGNRLMVDATIDVGCGEYGWHVEAPSAAAPTVSLSAVTCNPTGQKHSDVHDGAQDTWAKVGCQGYAGTSMKAGDQPKYWSPPGALGDWYQNFKISWMDGCTTFAEENPQTPVAGADDCYAIMRGLYKNCNNEGLGGWRTAGCLKYEFYVSG